MDTVKKRVADGNEAVIGHGRQDKPFCYNEECKKEELGSTPYKRDSLFSDMKLTMALGAITVE